ncbi:Crp/Fnr family transcriptional regulator [Sphingomonas qomolangmaensis]|uniref:Crp/Fnr family transcriptional regulator n=1 Tax=Sphingomonas qomolangmaensis TaxID=2918765 RepID=A0ABY5LBP0_9SPHN|nr:Crp/Fnr family transcriptional regulator [Sphingomonas qomolangmaensis]UUL83827.1 Crp/Fnr family transcriptional regulator [Sphingomonas qomolangmaensis]
MNTRTEVRTDNLLLNALSPDDLGLLSEKMERVSLLRDDIIVGANAAIDHVYFPDDGLASISTVTSIGRQTEVAIFGRDGVSATCLILDVFSSPHETRVQMAGMSAHRIETEHYLRAIERSPTLRSALLHYVQTLLVQAEHNAATNAHQRIEVRLARWLLMAHDRIDGDELRLTHEFMAKMVSAERSGVTIALHVLEGGRMIKSERGRVIMIDRPMLERLAGECYGLPEAEYRKLIGPLGRGHCGDG